MNKRSRIFLGSILLIIIVAISFGFILVANNLPGKTSKSPTAKVQDLYPAPRLTIVGKSAEGQGAYPPPSTAALVPTDTALPLKMTASPTAKGGLTENDVQRIALADAKAAFDGKKAVFLDVRSSESYASSHIPGAISIPEAQIMGRLNELDPNQWIIPYCS